MRWNQFRLFSSSSTTTSPAHPVSFAYQRGDSIGLWKVQEVTPVPLFGLIAARLEHPAGAQYLHCVRNDSNNVFCVGFPTPVSDSRGTPHVLEHTVLCGSEQYPIRDPFFKMLKRSMQTFMNAWTGLDYTMYPFSTQNKTDFENLMRVYLDATFFPRLTMADFLQEGHRLEPSDLSDPTSKLLHKGVVFNEMKGAMSDPSSLFYRGCLQAAFPDTPYGFNSGGDPAAILDLTHDDLISFHRLHYSFPAARFFSYGMFPLEDHLQLIEKCVVQPLSSRGQLRPEGFERRMEELDSRFSKLFDLARAPSGAVTSYPPAARDISVPGPVDNFAAPDRQARFSTIFPCVSANDTKTSFALSILATLLMDGPSSPLHKALLQSGLAADFSPTAGFDHHLRRTFFGIGAQGFSYSDVEKIRSTIFQVLESCSLSGFPDVRVQAALHRIELSQKNVGTNFGLNIAASALPHWLHGYDPMSVLRVHELVEWFRVSYEKSPIEFFGNLIRTHLLQNQERIDFSMYPDSAYSELLESELDRKLYESSSYLSIEQRRAIASVAIDLQHRQLEPEDISVLPSVSLNDVNRAIPFCNELYLVNSKDSLEALQSAMELEKGIETSGIFVSPQPTNGVLHATLSLSLPDGLLTDLERMLLGLYAETLSSVGLMSMPSDEFSDAVDLYTGGINGGLISFSSLQDEPRVREFFSLSSLALERNISNMTDLMSRIIYECNFHDVERLRNILAMASNRASSSVPDSGHVLARSFACSLLSEEGRHSELSGGISQVQFLNSLEQSGRVSSLGRALESLHDKILSHASTVRSLLVGNESLLTDSSSSARFLIHNSLVEAVQRRQESQLQSSVPFGDHSLNLSDFPDVSGLDANLSSMRKHFFSLGLPVNYCSKCIRAPGLTHPDSVKLVIAAHLLSANYLHQHVREKGGAYGASASYSSNGIFSMTSFRDPQSIHTVEVFDLAAEWIQSNQKLNAQNLEEAKLQVFQGLDRPVTPHRKPIHAFFNAGSDEQRQARREALFSTTLDEVRDVAIRYLSKTVQTDPKDVSYAIFGSYDKANLLSRKQGDEWNIHDVNPNL